MKKHPIELRRWRKTQTDHSVQRFLRPIRFGSPVGRLLATDDEARAESRPGRRDRRREQ
jgi:hypothetical protein